MKNVQIETAINTWPATALIGIAFLALLIVSGAVGCAGRQTPVQVLEPEPMRVEAPELRVVQVGNMDPDCDDECLWALGLNGSLNETTSAQMGSEGGRGAWRQGVRFSGAVVVVQ